MTLRAAAPGTTTDVAHGTPDVITIDGLRAGDMAGFAVGGIADLNGDGLGEILVGAPGGAGASVQVLYTPALWQPDANIYGTGAEDLMGPGYGGWLHPIGLGDDAILALAGQDTIDGDAGADSIEGGAGNDQLSGGAGNDLLSGEAGQDTLSGRQGDAPYLTGAGDTLIEALDEGTDAVLSGLNAALADNFENLTQTGVASLATGNGLDNVLTGNALANTLTGLAGNDTMVGGSGNDLYLVTEAACGDSDTVISTLNLTLLANLENLQLAGSATTGTGNSLATLIIGNALNNVLNGAAGVDTLLGGAGDDLNCIDNALDQVLEIAGEGNDTVVASVDYVLGAGVETLTLTGAALHGTGNLLVDTLNGTGLADALDSGAGVDQLVGGKGGDTYLIDNALDAVVETKTGGIDTVLASVDHVLAANVENLVLTVAAHHGTGNGLANVLTGTDLSETLDGGAGADLLSGGAGDDLYVVDSALDVISESLDGGPTRSRPASALPLATPSKI